MNFWWIFAEAKCATGFDKFHALWYTYPDKNIT